VSRQADQLRGPAVALEVCVEGDLQVRVVVGRIPLRHDRQDGSVGAEVTVEEVSDRDSRVLSTVRDIDARKRLKVFANLETSSSTSRGYPFSRGRDPS
jgi:hypothetical protein